MKKEKLHLKKRMMAILAHEIEVIFEHQIEDNERGTVETGRTYFEGRLMDSIDLHRKVMALVNVFVALEKELE
jgi:hypothetical protein